MQHRTAVQQMDNKQQRLYLVVKAIADGTAPFLALTFFNCLFFF